MTTQRLNTVINIGGGLSDRFRGSVQGGAEDIGALAGIDAHPADPCQRD